MTILEWLDARDPAPPPELAARVRERLGDAASLNAESAHDACLEAGAALLADVLAAGDGRSRDCALDLLTADALVTYAFEAACAEPKRLERRAVQGMARIAALGRPT